MRLATPTVFARLIEPAGEAPLGQQIYDGLRRAILDGQLEPGRRLPSTRALAADLGVARNTVVSAYERLLAEGYLEGVVGSGTFVAPSLPGDSFRAARPVRPGQPARGAGPVSRRGAALAGLRQRTTPAVSRPMPFRPGTPALDAFPWPLWQRLWQRRWRSGDAALLAYGDPAGYAPLREAIAAHVATARGVRCTAEQVIIVSGTHQGIELAARLLLEEGEAAWMEDPGYVSARLALRAAGLDLIAVPVDEEGLDVLAGQQQAPQARMCYVTPSHQYPLGTTLSLSRRLALLDWARSARAWILEDDYDSEFRYEGRPLAALAGLDPDGRVIYLGTFSKTLFPALRLSYLIVPADLAQTFAAARTALGHYASGVMQAVVADLLLEGHYGRHLRRMRTLYAERQAALVAAVQQELSGWLQVTANPTGLHLVGWLADGLDDRVISRRAAELGILAPPLADYRMTAGGKAGLVLGFAASDPRRTRQAVRKLAAGIG